MDAEEALIILRGHAREADEQAAAAHWCKEYRALYYYLCIEMRMQELHDRIADAAGLEVRCPHYDCRRAISEGRIGEIGLHDVEVLLLTE